jgi:hypothetical protein
MDRIACFRLLLGGMLFGLMSGYVRPAEADLGPMFCNVTQNFSGEMTDFIPVRGEQLGNGQVKSDARIISVVALDYNSKNQTGGKLKALGPVIIGANCIVKGRSAKSGWVSYNTLARFDKNSPIFDVVGVSFWVNDGGQNWWDFSLEKVIRQDNGQSITFTSGIEKRAKGGNLPFIMVNGHKMYPTSLVLDRIVFEGK